jgi:hypothetical protein
MLAGGESLSVGTGGGSRGVYARAKSRGSAPLQAVSLFVLTSRNFGLPAFPRPRLIRRLNSEATSRSTLRFPFVVLRTWTLLNVVA